MFPLSLCYSLGTWTARTPGGIRVLNAVVSTFRYLGVKESKGDGKTGKDRNRHRNMETNELYSKGGRRSILVETCFSKSLKSFWTNSNWKNVKGNGEFSNKSLFVLLLQMQLLQALKTMFASFQDLLQTLYWLGLLPTLCELIKCFIHSSAKWFCHNYDALMVFSYCYDICRMTF